MNLKLHFRQDNNNAFLKGVWIYERNVNNTLILPKFSSRTQTFVVNHDIMKSLILYGFTVFAGGGVFMQISYDKLWIKLNDNNMKKTDLKEITGMSSSTLAKLSKNREVNLSVLMRICEQLDCNVEDVLEFKRN